MDGPFCPKDEATLRYRAVHGGVRQWATDDVSNHDDDMIGTGPYHGRLVCPECSEEFPLATAQPMRKKLGASRDEAADRLEGIKRKTARAKSD